MQQKALRGCSWAKCPGKSLLAEDFHGEPFGESAEQELLASTISRGLAAAAEQSAKVRACCWHGE